MSDLRADPRHLPNARVRLHIAADKNIQFHKDLFLVPEGCLIIAQLFKVGSLGESGLSPEGTTETAFGQSSFRDCWIVLTQKLRLVLLKFIA